MRDTSYLSNLRAFLLNGRKGRRCRASLALTISRARSIPRRTQVPLRLLSSRWSGACSSPRISRLLCSKVGQAFNFDGINDFVSIANTATLDVAQGISLSVCG